MADYFKDTHANLPQEHLIELREKTMEKKNHLDYLCDIRDEFHKMTKEQLVEETVIAYDELVKVSKEKRELERDADVKGEMYNRMVDRLCDKVRETNEQRNFLNSLGYYQYCEDCGKWRKKCPDCGKWEKE